MKVEAALEAERQWLAARELIVREARAQLRMERASLDELLTAAVLNRLTDAVQVLSRGGA
eukprot:465065-Pyramimonas_sp.AAC.2